MSSIQYIYNAMEWKVVLEGESKITPGDHIYKMVIGCCDDEVSIGEIYEFISKDNYEKILNGTFSIMTFPYNEQKIIIIDQNNEIVPLIKGKEISEYELSPKKYVKQLTKKR